MTYESLLDLLSSWGYGNYHVRLVWEKLYSELAPGFEAFSDLRPDLHQRLILSTRLTSLDVSAELRSQDGQTVKYLLQLEDGESVETVLMRYPGRAIACISTQVGCAMGCVFCATGQMGFVRHLSAGEIVAQVIHVERILRDSGEMLRNIVIMGMGEPLHNYEATVSALSILMDDRGLAIAPRHITLSTVGLPDAIRRLADEQVAVNLAVSLHAVDDETRASLVPVSRRWPLQQVLDACRYYADKRNRRIFVEWTLISGSNDGPDVAHRLGQLLRGLNAHVNLIRLNPTADFDGLPSRSEAALEFQAVLSEYGLPSTIRQRRGIDIQAGCGQLRAQRN